MLLKLMAGRQLLRLAAAAMHVPPLHAAQLEAVAQLPAAAIAAAAAAMQQPLLAGISVALPLALRITCCDLQP